MTLGVPLQLKSAQRLNIVTDVGTFIASAIAVYASCICDLVISVRVLRLSHARFIRPVACVGSGDPVRVLRLYTTNTLDEV